MGTFVTPEALQEQALQFLKKQKLMVIGTSYKDQVWSATVAYAVTDDFELIFYSRPDTLHSQNIEQNKNVSAVITEMASKKSGDLSIQIAGIARKADGVAWNKYYSVYEKKYRRAKEFADRIIYVVKPNELWIIDETLLGHRNRVKVL